METNLNQRLSKLTIVDDVDDDDKSFEESVAKYPSSFDLKLDCLTKTKIQTIRDTLIGKLDNGFVLVDEKIQVYNLISYLSFKLQQLDLTTEYNRKALQIDRRNGIALANRARFNKDQHCYFDAEEDLKRLERLYGDDNAAATTKPLAEGEIILSYARFGPKFREIVISKYEALLRDPPRVGSDVLILWKYDYCLCLRRTLHLFSRPEHPDINAEESIRKACKVLSEIIDTSHSQIYKARAWAELGQLVYEIEKKPETLGPNVRDCIPIQKRHFSSQRCFDIALELGKGDFDVMEVCAKFLRYFNKAYESVSLFEEALKLRQTSLAYHHLALAIRKIELDKVNAAHQRPQAYTRNRRTVHTPRSKEKSHRKRTIKCGRKATILPRNEKTEKILYFLKLSLEQDPQNHSAAYDMAFMLRQLQRTNDAKEEFCKLLNIPEIDERKISCYEQAGYCCLDMAEVGGRASKRHTFDAIRFLQKAIEVAAGVAAKVKYSLLDVRPLIPTVNTMLSSLGLWETNNSQLQRLQNLLEEHGSLLPVVQDARSNDMSQIGNLVDKFLQDGDTDKAAFVAILDEIVTETDGDNFTQHMTTILDNALTCFSNEDYMSTKTMYRLFFSLLGRRLYKEDREYHIFLMTDEESENLESLYLVRNWLENFCGLKVINSDESCERGRPVLNSLMDFSMSSIAVFLIQRTSELEHIVDFVVTNIISVPPETPERRPSLVIVKDEEVKLKDAWINVPTVKLPKTNEDYSNSDISSWLNKAFRLLF